MKSTTYLCLVLNFPCVSKDLKGQACLAAHQLLFFYYHSHYHNIQLGKHFPFIDLRRQRRTNTWSLKQRVDSAQWKQAFPVLPSLVKMQVGRGNNIELRPKYWLFPYAKFGLHNIPIVFKIFPLLTCIYFSLLNNINTPQIVTILTYMHAVCYVK